MESFMSGWSQAGCKKPRWMSQQERLQFDDNAKDLKVNRRVAGVRNVYRRHRLP